jgi:hypothetical protein
MQLSLAILTYGAAISEVPLFQITIPAVQITMLVALKKYYTSSANATAKPNCWRLQLQFFSNWLAKLLAI